MSAFCGLFGIVLVWHLFSEVPIAQKFPILGAITVSLMKMLPSLYIVNRTRLDLINQMVEVRSVYDLLHKNSRPKKASELEPIQKFSDKISFENIRISTIEFYEKIILENGIKLYSFHYMSIRGIIRKTKKKKIFFLKIKFIFYQMQY